MTEHLFSKLQLDGIDRLEVQNVTSADMAAGWCKSALEKLIDGRIMTLPQLMYCLSDRMITHSSAYSGVLAPETSAEIISKTSHAFLHDRGCAAGPILCRQLWACENNLQAQEVIMAHESGPACCFDDLVSLAPEAVRKAIARNPDIDPYHVKDLLQTIARGPKPWGPRFAWCVRHGRMCKIISSDMHTAGNTCTDHSSFGKQSKMAGRHAKFFTFGAIQ